MTPTRTTRMQELRADRPSMGAAGPAPLVLVVDDLPVMRTLLGRYLSHLGFGMVGAGSAQEALEALRTRAPSHVILDVHFPGGSRAVFDAIRTRKDGLRQRTTFMTGGFVDPEMEAFVEGTGCPTIFKPFELGQIREILVQSADAPVGGLAAGPAPSTMSTSRG